MSQSKKLEAENVNRRVETTKKEIEQLKADLQQLINSGISKDANNVVKNNAQDITDSKTTTTNKLVIIKQSQPQIQDNKSLPNKQKLNKNIVTNPKQQKEETCKKNKHYDVNETREYMKKQKEKRAEQLKTQITCTENKLDLKKQKLRELHQRSLQLVTKNVQLKRERSKSRDRQDNNIRLDKFDTVNTNKIDQKLNSQDRLDRRLIEPKRGKVEKISSNNTKNSNKRSKSNDRNKKLPSNNGLNVEDNKIAQNKNSDRLLVPETLTSTNNSNHNVKKICDKFENSKSPKEEKLCDRSSDSTKNPNLLFPSKTVVPSNFIKPLGRSTVYIERKQKSIDLERTIFPPEALDEDISSKVETTTDRKEKQKQQPTNNIISDEQSHLKNCAIITTDPCHKETQTIINDGNKLQVPSWLQPNITPYPNNFINTVRRKLHYTLNNSKSIQNSISQTPKTEEKKSKEEIRELLIKSTSKSSNLKSFLSHKCLDLDLKAIENIGLITNNSKKHSSRKTVVSKKIDEISKKLLFNSDNESDTSKNIPEISSESSDESSSLRKKISSSSNNNNKKLCEYQLDINSDNLRNLKLKYSIDNITDSSIITTELQKNTKSLSDIQLKKDTYTLDFAGNSTSSGSEINFENLLLSKELSRQNNCDKKHNTSKSNRSSLFTIKNSQSTSKHSSNSNNNNNLTIPEINNSNFSSNKLNDNIETLSDCTQNSFFKTDSFINNNNINFSRNDDHSDQILQSLLSELQPTTNYLNENLSKTIESEISLQNNLLNTLPSLKAPKVSLQIQGINDINKSKLSKDKLKNITLRSGQRAEINNANNSLNNNANEIHLKFEAEVHLLNDFNESLKQFMAVEKAFEHLKNQNDTNMTTTKIFQNRDTQTSLATKSLSEANKVIEENSFYPNDHQISTINYSRGSEISEELNNFIQNNNMSMPTVDDSIISTGLELTNFNDSIITSVNESKIDLALVNVENLNINNCTGLSLNMFEQLIKDEDVRIQNLKTIIKIRERALLDRTKSELFCLQIQRKHLIETGQLEEASLIKKKQRGIVLKHEQERNEMKRLKQIQKEASTERKNTLKEQRNLIKRQLSTNNMLSKIKVNAPRERRHSGPLKVLQSRRESVRSEASISTKKSSVGEEILSATASFSQSIISRVSEEFSIDLDSSINQEVIQPADTRISQVKRALYMREAAIYKRRKAAEELLQWHRKLLEKEKKMSELEAEANLIITQIPSGTTISDEKILENVKFNGRQLNQLWKNMTGKDSGKFIDNKMYTISLEQFCKSARQYSNKNKKIICSNNKVNNNNISGINNSHDDDNNKKIDFDSDLIATEDIPEEHTDNSKSIKDNTTTIKSIISEESNVTINDYSSDFDVDTAQEIVNNEEQTQLSSISNLIDNFSKIENEISALNKQTIEDLTINEDKQVNDESKIDDIKEITNKTDDNNILLTESLSNEKEEILESFQKLKSLSHQISESLENSLAVEEKICNENSIANELPDDNLENVFKSDIIVIIEEEQSKPNRKQHLDEVIKIDEKLDDLVTSPNSNDSEADSEKFLKIVTAETFGEENEVLTNKSNVSEISKDSEIISFEENVAIKISTTDLVENIEANNTESVVSKEQIYFDEIINENDSIPKTDLITSISSNLASSPSNFDTKVVPENIISPDIEKSSEKLIGTSEEISENSMPSTAITTDEIISKDKLFLQTIEIVDLFKDKDLTESKESLKTRSEEEEEDENTSDADSSSSSILSKSPKQNVTKSENIVEETSEEENIESKKESELISVSKLNEENISEDSLKGKNHVDVKKRVSEILADLDASRGDKSPRLQDLYVTTYDVMSPVTSSEESTEEDSKKSGKSKNFGNEAEELLRKQLAIEQEIKQLEQQQKDQLPYVFMREIPNKPPPPYTPPSAIPATSLTVLPSDSKEINEITNYSSKILHKAYQLNNLENAKFSENSFKLISNLAIGKPCCEFVFDICKEIAKDHYKQFEKESGSSWLKLTKKSQLVVIKPLDANGLEKLLNKKLKELFGFKKVEANENAIIKWSRKKRDHVDEILVLESQEEESQWTNFDKDELIIKDEVTNDIMKMLVSETATVFNKLLSKKTNLY